MVIADEMRADVTERMRTKDIEIKQIILCKFIRIYLAKN